MKSSLSRLLKLSKSAKGFTLIELLVVIGILGILAASLVATIDPFEQLKKASDANVKNALVEFLDANVRYYTTHNAYPWDTVANNGAGCNNNTAPDGSTALNAGNMPSCVTALTNENELKAGFGTAVNLTKEIYITYTVGTNTLTGCFKPQSKSQQADGNTAFDSNGNPDGTKNCANAGLNNGCFWCTK